MDRKILAAAHASVRRKTAWRLPVALAASLVLGLGFAVVLMQQEQSAQPPLLPLAELEQIEPIGVDLPSLTPGQVQSISEMTGAVDAALPAQTGSH